ncbi:hypothetical protein [Kitasatospora sp. CB02891]|uniref:hypothetical protein n=1 Tax=Kitasatospora sp. CB02891 TaxID=2020329 RepID=UPI001E2DB594|nr:hypothetical protein [Kitasatospora sp. CB02891]
MARTTPPRPVDIAALFPELAPPARQAVRLHPRPGEPGVHEGSVGGPLLWPADEQWPICTRPHDHWSPPVSLDDVRRSRALLGARWLRPREAGENLLDPAQRDLLDRLQAGHPAHAGPNPLLPVAQLYLRDVPGLTGPEGADLLQVLWCPLDHDDALPAAHLVWRDSAGVGALLADPPAPLDVDHYGHYVPEPCALPVRVGRGRAAPGGRPGPGRRVLPSTSCRSRRAGRSAAGPVEFLRPLADGVRGLRGRVPAAVHRRLPGVGRWERQLDPAGGPPAPAGSGRAPPAVGPADGADRPRLHPVCPTSFDHPRCAAVQ